MRYKFIKLDKEEYFNIRNELDDETQIYLINGGRGVGKSYSVKDLVIDELCKGKQFVYLRNKGTELSTVVSWLEEADLNRVTKYPENRVIRGRKFKGSIEIEPIVDEGEPERIFAGLCVSLEHSRDIKSLVLDNVDIIVYEEYAQKGLSKNQADIFAFNFVEAIETIARKRNIKIICISNIFTGYSPIDYLFKDNPLCKKIRVKKKRKDDGTILGSIADKYVTYLEGEAFTEYKFVYADYAPLYNYRYNGEYIVIFVHRYVERFYIKRYKSRHIPVMNISLFKNILSFIKRYYSNSDNIIIEDDCIEIWLQIQDKVVNAIDRFYTDNIGDYRNVTFDKVRS